MKKIFAILLILTMSVSLFVGCGGDDANKDKNDGNVNQENDVNDDQENDASDDQENDADNEEAKGTQTVSLKVMDDKEIRISYNADLFEALGDEYFVDFQEIDGGAYFSVTLESESSASELIERYKGYDWKENYATSAITEWFLNGVLVQTFTETYTLNGGEAANTIYYVPHTYGAIAIKTEGANVGTELLEKLIVSIEGDGVNGITEDSRIALKDSSGKEMYYIYLTPAENCEVKLVSNENGKATFEYTAPNNDGEVVTRPVEISVNAYNSGQEYLTAVSGKYWTTYDPWESEEFGGKYVEVIGFWDEKTSDGSTQYQDVVFYLELEDGSLITGIYDYNHQGTLWSFFDMGFTPIQ